MRGGKIRQRDRKKKRWTCLEQTDPQAKDKKALLNKSPKIWLWEEKMSGLKREGKKDSMLMQSQVFRNSDMRAESKNATEMDFFFHSSSDRFLDLFSVSPSVLKKKKNEKISPWINSSSTGWLNKPVPSLWPCTPSFLHSPLFLRLSFSVSLTHTYTLDLTHNLKTCKEANLSAEYEQMRFNLEIERDKLDLDYLAKKGKERKK